MRVYNFYSCSTISRLFTKSGWTQNCIPDIALRINVTMDKTKALLRTKVFFVGMDALVQTMLNSCFSCQVRLCVACFTRTGLKYILLSPKKVALISHFFCRRSNY